MTRSVQDRDWYVDADPLYVDQQEELGQALNDLVTVLSLVGGGAVIAAHRKEVAPGNWMTVGFHIRWQSYVPAERYQEEPVEQADEVPAAA